jgi:hypothetical protein
MEWPLDKRMCCTRTKFESKLSHISKKSPALTSMYTNYLQIIFIFIFFFFFFSPWYSTMEWAMFGRPFDPT